MKCKKCNVDMLPSTAISQTYTAGLPDFPGMTANSHGQTISPGGPGKIISCLKCPECGHSVEDDLQDKEQ